MIQEAKKSLDTICTKISAQGARGVTVFIKIIFSHSENSKKNLVLNRKKKLVSLEHFSRIDQCSSSLSWFHYEGSKIRF